jgi:hypothetical protein
MISIPNIQNYLGAFSKYAEWICTYTENTRNESFHILRIRRKNLYVFGEYAEWGNIQTKFCCTYTDNTRNESVRILRICGMNLFVYWEYAECICTYTENTRNARKIEYLGKFETKIKNMFIRSLDGFVWPNHLKPKISCKSTFNELSLHIWLNRWHQNKSGFSWRILLTLR